MDGSLSADERNYYKMKEVLIIILLCRGLYLWFPVMKDFGVIILGEGGRGGRVFYLLVVCFFEYVFIVSIPF